MTRPFNPLFLCITALAFAPLANADALGGSLGASLWLQSFDAQGRDGGDTIDFDSDFDIDDESDYMLYASFEHPIPVIPNLLVQHTEAETAGNGVIARTEFDGVEFEGAVNGEIQLTHSDATLYYEILDNRVSLDIGLTARRYDASVVLTDDFGNRAEEEIDEVIPLLYGAAQFELPFTGWLVKAQAQYIDWDDSTLMDARGALAWESAIGLGVEVGYRIMDIDYESGDEELEATIEGVYGGLFWDF